MADEIGLSQIEVMVLKVEPEKLNNNAFVVQAFVKLKGADNPYMSEVETSVDILNDEAGVDALFSLVKSAMKSILAGKVELSN